MVKITSLSISEEELKELEELQKEMGLDGRSETIRAAISLLKLEQNNLRKISGKINALLIIIHEHSRNVIDINHLNEDLIKTHMHNHLSNHKCLDLFMIEGNSERIKEMMKSLSKNKKISLTKLIII